MQANEIIYYQSNQVATHIAVRIEDETVWLTQQKMAELFQTSRNNITLHIYNIFKLAVSLAKRANKDENGNICRKKICLKLNLLYF